MGYLNKVRPLLFATVTALFAGFFSYHLLERYVLNKAQRNIRDVLLGHRGLHHYIQKILHPEFYRARDAGMVKDIYYAPEIFSSSFIVRNMHHFFNQERIQAKLPEVRYKMASDNPRNPVNLADSVELELLEFFRKHPKKKEFWQVKKNSDGKKTLVFAMPFLKVNQACLRCHGRRSDSPPGLQARYPGEGGFNEKIGLLRAVEVLRVPLQGDFTIVYAGAAASAAGILALLALVFFNRNLNEQVSKKTQQLGLSEKQYRSLVENTSDFVIRMDHQFRLVFANRKFLEFLGKSEKELLDFTIFDFIQPDNVEKTKKTFEKWMETEKAHLDHQAWFANDKGQKFCLDWRIQKQYEKNQDSALSIIGISRDVTQRMAVLEALKQSQEELLQVQRLGSVGSFRWNINENLLRWTPEFYRLFDLNPNDFPQTREAFSELVHPEDRERLFSAFEKSLGGKSTFYVEHRMRLSGGEVRHVITRGRVIPQSNSGDSPIFLGYIQDVTEQVFQQQEQAALEARLNQNQKMESLGTLAGGIAHDFNNILGAIVLYSELSLDTDQQENSQEFTKEILNAANRAKKLVQQILTFSRLGEGTATPVDLNEAILDATRFLNQTTPATCVIESSLPKEKILILADPTQVHQVLINLGINAFQAFPEQKGRIEITLSAVSIEPGKAAQLKAGPYAWIKVSDNGTGIKREVLHRLFEPFFTTKPQGQGTGMGLAVVHGIVNSLGGDIQVESEPGKGTIMNILLPEWSGEMADGEVQSEGADAGLKEENPPAEGTILVVDDEITLARGTELLLKNLGHVAASFASSEKALAFFKKSPERFSMVLTDQSMPGLTGLELTREIKKIRDDIPIVIMTGFSSECLNENTIQKEGIQTCLIKPISKRELKKVLEKVLPRT